jgi:hypothetical protein
MKDQEQPPTDVEDAVNVFTSPAPRSKLFATEDEDEDAGVSKEEDNEEGALYVFDIDEYMGPEADRIVKRTKAFVTILSVRGDFVQHVLGDMERIIVISPSNYAAERALTPGALVFIDNYSKRKHTLYLFYMSVPTTNYHFRSARVHGMLIPQVSKEAAAGDLLLALRSCTHAPGR